jgi:hypothetical protein
VNAAAGGIAGIFGRGAARLALQAVTGPLLAGEPVVVVDAGNRFDPYEIARAERALGGSGREGLRRVHVSRAFTCHQLEALLRDRTAAAFARFGARRLLVLGLSESFRDADVPPAEAERAFRSCADALVRLAAEGARVLLVENRPFDPAAGAVGRDAFLGEIARLAGPRLRLTGSEAAVLRAVADAGEG